MLCIVVGNVSVKIGIPITILEKQDMYDVALFMASLQCNYLRALLNWIHIKDSLNITFIVRRTLNHNIPTANRNHFSEM